MIPNDTQIPICCRILWIPQHDSRLSFFDRLVPGESSLALGRLVLRYWIFKIVFFSFLNDITVHSEHGV